MTLTKRDKRKLAKAARELAGEYAEGRGPDLEPGNWCGCAAGQVFKRAGLPCEPSAATGFRWPSAELDIESFDCVLTAATWAVHGRDYYTAGAGGEIPPLPGAVVFPLLALADELEAQS